eukprot:6153198-Prymnesium_polylepis.1
MRPTRADHVEGLSLTCARSSLNEPMPSVPTRAATTLAAMPSDARRSVNHGAVGSSSWKAAEANPRCARRSTARRLTIANIYQNSPVYCEYVTGTG